MALNALKRICRRLLQPFQKSLRYKLMLLMVVIAVLPLSMVTLFATRTTKHSLSEEVVRSNESRMEWSARYFDEKFEQLQAVTYSLLLDKNLFPNVNGSVNDEVSSPQELDAYTTARLWSLYNANNKNIAQISLYLKSKQRVYTADKDASRTTDNLLTHAADWNAISRKRESVDKLTSNRPGTFTIVRSMNRFENREVLGGVTIDVRWSMMRSVMDMVHSEPNSQVLILDSQGNEMYNPYGQKFTVDPEIVRNAIAHPTMPGNLELKKGFLFYQPTLSGRLWIVKFIPIEYVTQGASSTMNFSLVTALIFIILAIVISIVTAYFTTKPIIRLTKSMKALEIQNFDVGLQRIRTDEIGTLERRFNSMLARIRELIQTEYKAKIEKRTAQVKAMQAQVNPHFLHNALQSIGGIALSRNVPEIYEHVRAISDLFRYAIRMQADLVTVADEMEHVRNYLQIQKLRFQQMIEVHLDVDEDCLHCAIPKFSLQPIVENCFIHGLEGKMETWSIVIRAEKVLDEVEITIADNGVGIAGDRLERIRKQLGLAVEMRSEGDSMGMGNVNARLKLMFGESYGLYVDSAEGTGTTVKLLIPAEGMPSEEESA
ncbi:sensor histidine kinase [Cohnella nanjingensis]|uniref:histidine kinase n=1 Tax=Cohnella nanjingensis TaxID=1387779 RepID=A0A7X0RQE1_9BACL|nr:histidine kinase [Cohnella nanjingensis]MBB6671548.1 sensor histidine kinase [Cohnella nanjingensis]